MIDDQDSAAPDDGAAGPVFHEVDQSADEVARYWTDERIRDARPAPQPQPKPRRRPPAESEETGTDTTSDPESPDHESG